VTVTDEPMTTDVPPGAGRSPRGLRTILLAAVIVIAAVAGAVVGRATGQSTPGDHSVDAGFARDMSVHHAQAVEMSMLVIDRTTDSEIRVLATDIALTQQEQIGRMKGWLVSWRLSPSSDGPAMAWMADSAHQGHGKTQTGLLPDGRMPGMASTPELDRLRDLSGRPAETLFLQLMSAHHRGGIPMAEYAAKQAHQAEIRELAMAIAAGQTAEIETLRNMLRARGSVPA